MIELTLLHEALVGELRDLYGAEKQLLSSLSRMGSKVRTVAMSEIVSRLLSDTSNHLWRLEEAFRLLDEDISRRHCLGMARILDTRKQGQLVPPEIMVAATTHKATHFLSAVHATAAARARALGYYDVARLLDASAAEATAAARGLTMIAATTPAAGAPIDARH
jgi:ferritin-like metal-binding protein YciE